MPEQQRPLKVFLCHSHDDQVAVRVLYKRLIKDGIQAWLDKENLDGGANWEYVIRKAVRESDIVVVCLSRQFSEGGFRQKEVQIALDEAALKPKEEVFIIPVRLEECNVPEQLGVWHWLDLFRRGGYKKLIRSLNKRIVELNDAGATGQTNISVVISGQVGGNVIVGNDNSVQQTPAQQPIEAEKQEPRMFYDLPRHFEHVVPNANAETIAKVILEAVTRIMWFTEIPDENNEDRNIQYATEKGEYYDPKNNNTLQHALIIHGQKSILLGKKKNGTDGFRAVQQIEALPEMLIITVTQRIDGAILRLDSEKIPDKIFQQFVKMALREIGIQSVSNGSSLADETKKTKVTTPNEGNKKKLNPAYVVAIIGLIGTLLAALIWILPQFIKPTPTVPAASTTLSSAPTKDVVAVFSPTKTKTLQSTKPTHISSPTPFRITEITDSLGVSMVLVPSGEFIMGETAENAFSECEKYSSSCQKDQFMSNFEESPPHKVVLDSYYIDKYEVTNELYKACVKAGVCFTPQKTSSYTHASYYGNPDFDNYPVAYVNWKMAKTYCEWRGVRLPTEAEWEKAARGVEARTYPWGDNLSCNYANYSGGNGCFTDPVEVGSYEAGKSFYGAYEMGGNVKEWVSSLYQPYPYNASDGREDLDSTGIRVLRGGSWIDGAYFVRSASRYSFYPDKAFSFTGFRCARDAQP